MAAMAQLRPFSANRQQGHYSGHIDSLRVCDRRVSLPANVISPQQNLSFSPLSTKLSKAGLLERFDLPCAVGGDGSGGKGYGNGSGGDGGSGWSGGGGGGGGGSGEDEPKGDSSSSPLQGLGVLGLFLNGWRSRVAADPQFPFKVLMEELVGVSSCVLGDMASRPNFGLNELDFVFSTLVVGCILNFTLMYLLAPTMASSAASNLPALFANCPKSHMFEPGSFTLLHRVGTFVYKGAIFSTVGFAAGLVGTALSNGLIKMRKKMDPTFETPNKAPPTVLNALTWAIHMGLSSNLRYQTLNGAEFVLEKSLAPVLFKTSVIVMRCLNNVLGGVSFVVLARLTGAQSVDSSPKVVPVVADEGGSSFEKEKLIEDDEEYKGDENSSK